MEITRQQNGETLELKIQGRVDGYWSDHLAAAVDQEIRQGSHHIHLDLSQVRFLSSAGIGTLVRLYKELKSIQGTFAVTNCSHNVLKVIQLSKLEDILIAKAPAVSTQSQAAISQATVPTKFDRPEAGYELYQLNRDARLNYQQIGDSGPLANGGFRHEHCRSVQFADSTFAIGLGALGDDFEDSKSRLGEFIAIGGAVAYQPSDGTNVPDFMFSDNGTTPEAQVCYGLACHAGRQQPFMNLLRFDVRGGIPIRFTALLETCLQAGESEQVGVVMIAETTGLVGAALRRPPVQTSAEQDPFSFPEVRSWLSFTAEPSYRNRVALVAGIVARERSGVLAPLIRPYGEIKDASVAGHFHAAAFSYRPVQRGQIDLKSSIKTLFEAQTLEGILHLLTDDRAISGAGESEFVRGACWVAPLITEGAAGAGN